MIDLDLLDNELSERSIFFEPLQEKDDSKRKRGKGWVIVLAMGCCIIIAAHLFSLVKYWNVTYSYALENFISAVYLWVDGSFLLLYLFTLVLFISGKRFGWQLLMFTFLHLLTGKLKTLIDVLLNAPEIITKALPITILVIMAFPGMLLLPRVRHRFGINARVVAVTIIAAFAMSITIHLLISQFKQQ